MSIVSDRGATFTSVFWQELHKAMGTGLDFITAFHPQTDGQSKRAIQTLEDRLWTCMMNLVVNRTYTCHKQNLHITTVIMQVLKWLHMKHCMEENTDHLCIGKLMRDS